MGGRHQYDLMLSLHLFLWPCSFYRYLVSFGSSSYIIHSHVFNTWILNENLLWRSWCIFNWFLYDYERSSMIYMYTLWNNVWICLTLYLIFLLDYVLLMKVHYCWVVRYLSLPSLCCLEPHSSMNDLKRYILKDLSILKGSKFFFWLQAMSTIPI